MAFTDNHAPGPAYGGRELPNRRTSASGHHVVESLDSIHMNIEEYAAHEQAEMQAWLMSSQDSSNGVLSATIDAVRRQSYTRASPTTLPSQHGHSYPVTSAKTSGISGLATHLESPETMPVSPRLEVKPSAIPLPKSYYTSPLATPRGAKSPRPPTIGIPSGQALPSSCLPVSPTTPCALPATPKKGASPLPSPATPKKGATLPEDEEDSLEKQTPAQLFSFSAPPQQHPDMGYTQMSSKPSQKQEHVAPPAPRYSADHEVPIFAADQAEDQTEDQSENMDGSPKVQHNNNMSSWTSGIVAGAAAVQNSCFIGDKASSSPGSGQSEDALNFSVLVQASGDSFLKGLQDSGLLPASMSGSQRDGGDHSRQGSWPKLGFVDNNEQMDDEILSGTLKLPSTEKASTYFQNNTLYGASPPLSPRPDDDLARSLYRPPSQYASAYGSGSGSTPPADTAVPKGFFEGLFSKFVTGGNHKGSGGSREKQQMQEPRSIVEFTDAPPVDPAEIARDLPTATLPQAPSASPPPSVTPSATADPSSPCRTLMEYSTDSKEEPKDDTMTPLSPGRFATYGAGGYADSPRDCSVSNIYPPNSARSEYYAYRRGGWAQGNDTMGMDGDDVDVDVDGEQLSAQLQKLLSSSVIMIKESAAEEQQAAAGGWQADLEAETNASHDAPSLAPRSSGFAPMASGAYSMESPRVRQGHVALTKRALEEASSAGVPGARPEAPGQHVWQHHHHRPPISSLPSIRPGSRRDTGSTECDDDRSEKTESTVVVTDPGINSAEELKQAVMLRTHRSTWSSVSARHNAGHTDSYSGRTMSLVDMVEVQSQQAGGGSLRAAEVRPTGGRPAAAAAAAASVTGESENSEAERLEVLKEELGRVLKLLTSRPPEEQDKDKIRKLLDLQTTVDGVQNEMQATSGAGQNPVQKAKPAQQVGGGSPRAVEVSVDFTHDGPALCVVEDGSAGKGSLATPEIVPAPDSDCPKPARAEPAPSKRMIRSLLRRQRGQPGCFSRLFHCGCYPAADERPRSTYPAIPQPANPAGALQL